MGESAATGKNIVLCSDGTGNSGGKGRGTNVWRLFQAVDLSKGDQVAFHDDGVGTEDFKLLKIVAGATGYGLGRNIRELYASLVRVYDPGDRVFLYGFSRGAYTVRSLANFIHIFGILDRHAFATPDELTQKISGLYKDYRRTPKDPLIACATAPESHPKQDGVIAMLGVWDTVDAIGVPVDGLRDLARAYLGLKHHEYESNNSVWSVFHALAIDDERQSFHPTMFDETEHSPEAGPIEQVWFAGMHSNVGGGYPKDQVAYISLYWMMRNASDEKIHGNGKALRFHPGALDEVRDVANLHGKVYDSRSGLSAYYRPRHRDVGAFSRSTISGKAKIHASVMARIARRTDGYAPSNIQNDYEVVGTDAAPKTLMNQSKPTTSCVYKKLMARAEGFATWRRRLYFAFLAVTLWFIGYLVWGVYCAPTTAPADWQEYAAGLVKKFVPIVPESVVDPAFSRADWLAGFIGLLGLLFWMQQFVKRLIRNLASMAWRAVYLETAAGHPSSGEIASKYASRQNQRQRLEDLTACISGSGPRAIAWAFKKAGMRQWVLAVLWTSLIAIGAFSIDWPKAINSIYEACSTGC